MGFSMKEYYSHKGKLLQVHLQGVAEKVRNRNLNENLAIVLSEKASLFHDTGKINLHFQNKLNGTATGYDNHAYLSAYIWLCFCDTNGKIVKEWFGNDAIEKALVTSLLIARHHGNLPDLGNLDSRIFNPDEIGRLSLFLKKEGKEILASAFLSEQLGVPHKAFDLSLSDKREECFKKNFYQAIKNPLYFFHNIQFGFSCLIEADKRDAGDNKEYVHKKKGKKLNAVFDSLLNIRFDEYTSDTDLNRIRTEVRNEAIANLIPKLDAGERVFTLTSPTGSGKTMMLLALANEILKRHKEHTIIYALPFLSITEQVEKICKEIFCDELIMRIDSKSENKEVQALLEESDANPEKMQELLKQVFSELTFDHPFIITTFVKLFETLVSNRNSTLLKLPNFSKTVFLIDEIQALPPRLYIFFVALLEEFCRRFDSYAIFSTATMPYLEIEEASSVRKVFADYPKEFRKCELIDSQKYFAQPIFNRYTIVRIENDNFTIQDLADEIRSQEKSCLVILNTIQDTKDLYETLSNGSDEIVLLNTHFHLQDRKAKIDFCKERLNKENSDKNNRVVLISTQLIEAGVDIDFPVLYRDICPLPSVIQSAGRCNRNGRERGLVKLFELRKENGGLSAELIYRDSVGKDFLDFCRSEIRGSVSEKDLFDIQKNFFKEKIGGLVVGRHYQKGLKSGEDKIEMVECIQYARFETLGQFRLIDEKSFGEEYRYYIPINSKDTSFYRLQCLVSQVPEKGYEAAMKHRTAIETLLKSMADRIVTVRLFQTGKDDIPQYREECLEIRELLNAEDYSPKRGLSLKASQTAIL
jgi:CRISPR-associated endonuclease/helicase Cas3